MKQEILHTPEGVRDIYGIECRRKLVLEEKLKNVLHLYGYQDIQTPMFEFFDVFGKEIGTISSKELYKFFDRDGNILALRPDITPSIARVAATFLESNGFPTRLCYSGNTFINHSSYRGKLKENTQLGAELLGVDSPESDAELIALAADCLAAAGLKEFQIHIGNVDFFESLIADADLKKGQEIRLRELIANRNYFGVEELLNACGVKTKTKTAFRVLEELTGGIEVMEQAKEIAPSEAACRAIHRLEETYEILTVYGVEKYVTFDLSMSGTYGYYTGMIFRGYTYGTGDAIVKGGRYDHLLEKFGKESPSVGFAIVIDELMNALLRQKLEIPYHQKNTLILYEECERSRAIALAKEFRLAEKPIELLQKSSNKPLDAYVAYARQNFCGGMFYLKREDEILMTNLLTDEKKTVGWEEII